MSLRCFPLVRTFFVCAMLAVTVLQGSAHAAAPGGRGFGLGVIFGDPTGLTGKVWQGGREAFDVGLAYALDDYLLIYGDYLYHFPGAFGGSTRFFSELTPYIGIGPAIWFGEGDGDWKKGRRRDSVGIAARIPLGMEWTPSGAPLGVFLELAPGVALIPGVFGIVQGGIGIRYYF